MDSISSRILITPEGDSSRAKSESEEIKAAPPPPAVELDSVAEDANLPKLDFRPGLLNERYLVATISFHLFIIVILILLYARSPFKLDNLWTYFAAQILPVVVGTGTSILLDSITMGLSRVTPYSMCADGGRNGRLPNNTAKNTMFRSYFPMPGLRDAFFTGNSILVASIILSYGNPILLAFKASLFVMNTSFILETVPWAAISLIVLYTLLVIYYVTVIFIYDGDQLVCGGIQSHSPTNLRCFGRRTS